MMKVRYIRFLSAFLALTVMLGLCTASVTAETASNEQPPNCEQTGMVAGEASAASARSLYYTEIVGGASYALMNSGSGLWAGTVHSSSDEDIHNLHQASSWSSNAQTFRFVETEEDTFIIYPLGYGDTTAEQPRALYCNASWIESSGQILLNVYPEVYSAEQSEGFEWLVQYEYNGLYTIRLKAYPNYCLMAIGTEAGNPATTGIYDAGNIVAYYVNPTYGTLSSLCLWDLKYVIPNGTYFIKNRGVGLYMQAPTTLGVASLKEYSGDDLQKWMISHISNGRYFITSTNGGALALLSSTPEDNDYVNVESNMAQPRFWWTIDRTSNGSFKIQGVLAADYEYALKDTINSLGRHYVASGEYWEDTDYSDEWYLYEDKYTFTTNHYYDQGYICRYESDDISARECIKHYQSIVSERVLTLFNLRITATYNEIEESKADYCKTLPLQFDDLDDFCNHTTNHLSRPMQREGAPNGDETKTTIIWTGHLLYEKVEGQIAKAYSSDSHATQYKVLIPPKEATIYHDTNQNGIIDDDDYYTNKAAEQVEEESVYDLMHEISHQLELYDHYCYGKKRNNDNDDDDQKCANLGCLSCHDKTNAEGYDCIMYRRLSMTEIMGDSVYCTVCINRMKAHLTKHH